MRGYLNLPRHWNEEIATESSDPEKKIHSLNETRASGDLSKETRAKLDTRYV